MSQAHAGGGGHGYRPQYSFGRWGGWPSQPWLSSAGYGSEGADPQLVYWLQACLAQSVGSWVPQTGTMGPATRRAVRMFQSQHSLPANGVLDNDTIAALQKICPNPPAPAGDFRAASAAISMNRPPSMIGEISPPPSAKSNEPRATDWTIAHTGHGFTLVFRQRMRESDVLKLLFLDSKLPPGFRLEPDPNSKGERWLFFIPSGLSAVFDNAKNFSQKLVDALGQAAVDNTLTSEPEEAAAKAIRLAIQRGERDENRLTDLGFNARHPERRGQRVQQQERLLVREWLEIRDRLVRPALRAPAVPTPVLVWPTSSLPPSETGRFLSALNKLEARVNSIPDPRNWRYLCWFEKLRKVGVDDRVITWSAICPAHRGAVPFTVGPCDITMGWSHDQGKIEKGIRAVADVNTVGQSLGIIIHVKSSMVLSEEMTSQPVENLRMLHDNVQLAIDNLDKWANPGLGGGSAMPTAYVFIKDWIGGRQSDPNSIYSCG